MKKILIVEDDKFLRNLIAQKLLEEDYNVLEAIDAEKGLADLEKNEKPNLILLDLKLPKMDGFKFLSEIKKSQVLKEIPVIILSNTYRKEDVKKGLEMGAVDYLIKAHFTPGEIIEKIKAVLE